MKMKRPDTLILTILLSLLFSGTSSGADDLGERTTAVNGPYLEWELLNPSVEGNPFDLAARVTFSHTGSDDARVTEMFHDGGQSWKFRFTATRPGTWTFRTECRDPDLDGHTGTVRVAAGKGRGANGFMTNIGSKWAWEGTGMPFVPQYVMYKTPDAFAGDRQQVEKDIDEFIRGHGFNGFHVPTIAMGWFDITLCSKGYDALPPGDPNPDPRTFEALEMLISKTYLAGGAVHIWQWGDQMRKQTPRRWGANEEVDRRLQRYIAARLGPLPGWSMGYGFDLFEWVEGEQLTLWHDYMQEHFGWHHYLGARSYHDSLVQISDDLDYSSYQQHRPGFHKYVETIAARPDRPSFSEDRFRIRRHRRYWVKDYDTTRTRRGLWHSTLAGGVANIWGCLVNDSASFYYSLPYPNKQQIKTWSIFFHDAGRFLPGMHAAVAGTKTYALVDEGLEHYIFYTEEDSSMDIDLSRMPSRQAAVAVDTRRTYRELPLGMLEPGTREVRFPYLSDWAVAVGSWPSPARDPVRSVGVEGRHVSVNGRPVFLAGQMDYSIATGRTPEETAGILDVMMVPFGMNLVVGDLGVIDWGAWNNLVNVRRGKEKKLEKKDYPWKRSGGGETNFGGPRFDLDEFDPAYFEKLAEVIGIINGRGIVPVVGIFSEHGIDHPLHWRGHPFHPANNINELDLPEERAIPEFFEHPQAMEYQERYVLKLLESLSGVQYILSPFGEVKRAPDKYLGHWLRLFEAYEKRSGKELVICLSGSSDILDRMAGDPAVDLLDVFCYHEGRYDGRAYNIPGGSTGIIHTLEEAWRKYEKPVGKLYFKYGYPYKDPASPWADPETGTQDGGPPEAARQALEAVYENGGFGIFFKMSWNRDRGIYMEPDAWSEDIGAFMESIR
jgi:hypothetical protein